MQRKKDGMSVGPDDIPVEVWKCLGESALKFLTKLYNITMEIDAGGVERHRANINIYEQG